MNTCDKTPITIAIALLLYFISGVNGGNVLDSSHHPFGYKSPLLNLFLV